MKKLKYLVMAACCMVINACRKQSTEATYPASVDFELIDKSGNSLIKSLKDSVKVSYTQDGVVKYRNLSVDKLQVSSSDTTTVKYYNGLVINDRTYMSSLSGGSANEQGTIHNFVIYINGVSVGNVYLDYWNMVGHPAPSQAVTFNNMPCDIDRSFPYFSPGSSIVLLQMQ